MSLLELKNPLQTITVSAVTATLVLAIDEYKVFSFLQSQGSYQYVLLLLSILAFMICIGLTIRLGQFIDFLLTPECKLRGLYVEAYVNSAKNFLAFYSIKYSVPSRKFVVTGIAFQNSVDGDPTVFEPHSRWDSTGVTFRHDEHGVSEICYFYKGQHFGSNRDSYPPGYTRVQVRDSLESSGYYSDIDGQVHTRKAFQSFRLHCTGGPARLFQFLFNSEGSLIRLFNKDELKGAELASMICKTVIPPEVLRRSPGQAYLLSQAKRFELPGGLQKWLKDRMADASKKAPANSSDQIIRSLQKSADRGYAKFSKLQVASCVVSTSGNQYYGVNCENQSFPEGLCAEAVAIGAMVTAGEQGIAELYVFSPGDDDIVPCGGCLQRISEFASAEVRIHTVKHDRTLTTRSLSRLLPENFAFRG